jgi:ComF family protein
MIGYVKRLFTPLVDFVYPPTCLACDEILEEGTAVLCHACWSSIEILTESNPLYRELEEKFRRSHILHFSSRYVFEKDKALQTLIHYLKYRGHTNIGIVLGKKIGTMLLENGIAADGVVPIPLHPARRRERGYNQSDYLARGLNNILDIPVYHRMLERTRNTPSQTHLTILERQENVRDAFRVVGNEIKGKHILLVDDVITTGATVISASECLLNAGAKTVSLCSIAVADK